MPRPGRVDSCCPGRAAAGLQAWPGTLAGAEGSLLPEVSATGGVQRCSSWRCGAPEAPPALPVARTGRSTRRLCPRAAARKLARSAAAATAALPHAAAQPDVQAVRRHDASAAAPRARAPQHPARLAPLALALAVRSMSCASDALPPRLAAWRKMRRCARAMAELAPVGATALGTARSSLLLRPPVETIAPHAQCLAARAAKHPSHGLLAAQRAARPHSAVQRLPC